MKQAWVARVRRVFARLCAFFGRIPWRKLLSVGCMLLVVCFLFSLVAFAVSAAVCNKTKGRISTPDALQGQEFDCILVLGCRVYADGRMSNMLEDRMQVGVSLYLAGLADKLLLSGDSQYAGYDEIGAMRAYALAAGVPEEAILCDTMGLSTYDSISHLKRFGMSRVLVVTQTYHLYRALYVAEKLGLEPCGVSADLRSYRGQLKRELREIAARWKDVFFALAQPPAAEIKF